MGAATSKSIHVELPAHDGDRVKLLPAREVTLDRLAWRNMKEQFDLSCMVDDSTGQLVFGFRDLVTGASYRGIPKGATTLRRPGTPAKEFEGVRALIAAEEGVTLTDVELKSDLLQIFDPSAPFTVLIESDLVAHVPSKNVWYIGLHKPNASDVRPIGELGLLMKMYEELCDDPEYVNLQGMAGSDIKGVFCAEAYQVQPAGLQRIKASAARRKIMLLRRSGASLTKAQSTATRVAMRL